MNYTDSIFIFVFCVQAACVRSLTSATAREWAIVAFSLIFMMSWGLYTAVVFYSIITLNYALIASSEALSRRHQHILFNIAIALNICFLAIFKYATFVATTFNELLSSSVAVPNVALPLAISFYIFHLVSYISDLKSGKTRRIGLRGYLMYLGFFPHVIAGPIVRSWQFFPQIGKIRHVRSDIAIGFHHFAAGVFLKAVLADNLSQWIDPVWSDTHAATLTIADRWVVAGLYYCQIYGDFAGYSLMALGMSRILGYRLPPNFRQPMFASSLQDFWRCWHITLSQWLRDYLYKPLGGSRNGRIRTSTNLLLTMILGGLWHGAAWTFVIWGTLHGLGLLAERILGMNSTRGPTRIAWLLVTQLWVTLAWIFFRAPDLNSAFDFLAGLVRFSDTPFHLSASMGIAAILALLIILYQVYERAVVRLPHKFVPASLGIMAAVFAFADIVFASPNKAFIYFKF